MSGAFTGALAGALTALRPREKRLKEKRRKEKRLKGNRCRENRRLGADDLHAKAVEGERAHVCAI